MSYCKINLKLIQNTIALTYSIIYIDTLYNVSDEYLLKPFDIGYLTSVIKFSKFILHVVSFLLCENITEYKILLLVLII